SAHLPKPSTLRCHIVGHRVAQHPARSSTTPSVPGTHAPRLQQPFSPHPTTLLPQHLRRVPPIRLWRPQATIPGRARDAHHVPPTSTAAFSSTPRARPSQSCDLSPRHAQGP
ncbi:hypothetical protein K438DRAFT_1841936, partial [Mycena galopus ATCC 62051]